jgi:hypothetical protein
MLQREGGAKLFPLFNKHRSQAFYGKYFSGPFIENENDFASHRAKRLRRKLSGIEFPQGVGKFFVAGKACE